jgi:predicted pyridoxine 5'-phosphate oxidase superfamily flavin-nucleotide-binding protein
MEDDARPLVLSDIAACFEGIIPAEIATASADGVPNVTHLSRVHMLDDERVVLSNQFFSKTTRNLAENPRACVVVIDPNTYDSYRLLVQYERTERRGPIYERLRRDIDAIAALTGMEGVFKLRSADVYRVLELELVRAKVHDEPDE